MNPKKPRRKCKNCGKECNRPSAIYCSNKCQLDYQYKQYIKRWLKGKKNGTRKPNGISGYIRRYMFEKHNNKCQKCNWGENNQFTNKIPLTIHHKDGNWKNCSEDNLELLCPNCHSLTENYGVYNKGNGRKNRPIARKHLA